MPDTPLLIWSFKHRMWWGPNRRGYTPDAAQAGRYSPAAAGDIVVGTGIPNENAAVWETCVDWWLARQQEVVND